MTVHRQTNPLSVPHVQADPFDLTGVATMPAWFDGALCAQVDHDPFYPEAGISAIAAKATCARCDIREQCLEWAIDSREPFGIWGGKSPLQRKRIRQAREVS